MGKKKGNKPKGMSIEEFSKEQAQKEASKEVKTGLEAILDSKETAKKQIVTKPKEVQK